MHGVYSTIAPQFSATRYKPWPRVLEFVLATPPGGVLIDVGCGNGKNLGRLPRELGIVEVGCDRSVELLRIAVNERRLPVVACDCLALPFRAGCADRVICIAVLHHLATAERRLAALRRMFALLRPDADSRMLVYVWSTRFAETAVGRGQADASVLPSALGAAAAATAADVAAVVAAGVAGADVFVGFASAAPAAVPDALGVAAPPPPPSSAAAIEHGRYYHLFAEGELEALCASIGPRARVARSWFDSENWAAEVVMAPEP